MSSISAVKSSKEDKRVIIQLNLVKNKFSSKTVNNVLNFEISIN